MIFPCILEVFEQERKSSNLVYSIWEREQPMSRNVTNEISQ